MRLWSNNGSSWRRALLVAPVLAANLIAAAVPVLHSASHHHEHRDHAPMPVQAALDEQQHPVHPPGLHDEWRIHGRVAIDLAVVVSARLELLPPPVEVELVLSFGADAPESRAPPADELARAPPTV